MNLLTIRVDEIANVIAQYNQIKVYSAATEDGVFTTVEGTVTLVAGQELYTFVDIDGGSTLWYKTSYYKSPTGPESDKSAAVQATQTAIYASADDLRQAIGKLTAGDDDELWEVLSAASRLIDGLCQRSFDRVTDTRYFDGSGTGHLWVDDLVSVSSIKMDQDGDDSFEDETALAATDYYLWPYNAAREGKPYEALKMARNGNYSQWGKGERMVQVAGVFGWPNVPKPIERATIIAAKDILDRQREPYTLSLASLEGADIKLSPSAQSIINRLIRRYKRGVLFA